MNPRKTGVSGIYYHVSSSGLEGGIHTGYIKFSLHSVANGLNDGCTLHNSILVSVHPVIGDAIYLEIRIRKLVNFSRADSCGFVIVYYIILDARPGHSPLIAAD